MNLIELFDTLSIPEQANEKRFNAISIPEHSNFRIATDNEGNPVLLLSVNIDKQTSLRNFRFKHLQLAQNIECKIAENNQTDFQIFTVITFTSHDKNLRLYFLRVAETLVKSLSTNPTQQQIAETLNKFVEIFRSLGNPPTKTVQGLWSELFLIENSSCPRTLLTYWHNSPEDKFDFDSGLEKIEVKSSTSFKRTHHFSSEQLNPNFETQVLIASIFMLHSNSGKDIQNLIDSITDKLLENFELINKLNNVVCRTLGNSFEESIKIKYDYKTAKDTLRFYKHQDLPKIQELHIPIEVSEVKYKSDLSSVKPINTNRLLSKGMLFGGI